MANLIMTNWYIKDKTPYIVIGTAGENNATSISIECDEIIENAEYFLDIGDSKNDIFNTQELTVKQQTTPTGEISYILYFKPMRSFLGKEGVKLLQVRCEYIDNDEKVTKESNVFHAVVNKNTGFSYKFDIAIFQQYLNKVKELAAKVAQDIANLTLGNLKDTNIVDPTDGQVIKYDAETQKWVNGEGGGSGGSSNYNELSNKPKINNIVLSGNKTTSDLGINIPTKTSDLTNDSNFVADANYVHTDNNYTNADKTIVNGVTSALASKANSSDLASVATSGDYDDLINKPSIPSVSVTQVLESGTKIAEIDVDGTKTKLYAPSGGGASSISDIMHDTGAGYAGGQNKKFNCSHGVYYDDDNKLLYFYSVNPFGNSATTPLLLEWDMSNPYSPVVKRTLDLNSVVTFQHGSLNVTSIDKYDKYLYIATRSTDGGAPSNGYDNTSIWGALIIVDTTTFTVAKTETFNGKCSCVNVFKASNNTIYMVVNAQMSYMKVYTLNPSDLTDFTLYDTQYFSGWSSVEGWTDYIPKIQEQQQGKIFETPDNKVLFATAGFADGVRIWDITNITTTRAILYNWYSGDHADMWKNGSINLYHAFAVTVNYPYAYFSLGAGTSVATSDHNNGTNNRRMGVLTLDFSDLNNLAASIQNIAIADMNDFVQANQADPSPTNIMQVNDKLFLGNGDKGVAIFDISTPSAPIYVGNKVIPKIQIVGAMCKTELGNLLIGDQIAITINPDKGYSRKKYLKVYGVQ